jgi:uncharacterized NAD-dependent epimerase/dehydratase family protein
MQSGATLIDLRRTDEREVATGGEGFRPECLRIHTVAPDCSCGKMVAAVEVARGLSAAGIDAGFVATGQTGMLIAGGGVAIDAVVADFVAGAAERLVRANQHRQAIVVEGQGSLFDPRYSGVTLSLLHGVRPDAMVMVHPMGRTEGRLHARCHQDAPGALRCGPARRPAVEKPGVKLPPLERAVELYETMASAVHPSRVIGIAVNGFGHSDADVAAECERLEQRLALPATDLIRHGPAKLIAAVKKMLASGAQRA